MKPSCLLALACLLAGTTASSAATFVIAASNGIIAPSTRGQANTTYFGWELFGSEGAGGPNIVDDTTPDIGTNPGGVRIVTTNAQDHTPFAAPGAAANIYTFNGTLSEDLTMTTAGTNGSGFTTLIIQGISAPQGNPTYFSGQPTFGDIAGVTPTYISGLNAAGIEQFLVRYDLPGNLTNYTTSMIGSALHFSLDKLVVDTYWSATGYQGDTFAATPEPGRAMLLGLGVAGMCLRRRRRVTANNTAEA